jgi:hypothetical protein
MYGAPRPPPGSGRGIDLTLITRYTQTPHGAGYGFGLTTFVAGLVLIPFSVLGFVAGIDEHGPAAYRCVRHTPDVSPVNPARRPRTVRTRRPGSSGVCVENDLGRRLLDEPGYDTGQMRKNRFRASRTTPATTCRTNRRARARPQDLRQSPSARASTHPVIWCAERTASSDQP